MNLVRWQVWQNRRLKKILQRALVSCPDGKATLLRQRLLFGQQPGAVTDLELTPKYSPNRWSPLLDDTRRSRLAPSWNTRQVCLYPSCPRVHRRQLRGCRWRGYCRTQGPARHLCWLNWAWVQPSHLSHLQEKEAFTHQAQAPLRPHPTHKALVLLRLYPTHEAPESMTAPKTTPHFSSGPLVHPTSCSHCHCDTHRHLIRNSAIFNLKPPEYWKVLSQWKYINHSSEKSQKVQEHPPPPSFFKKTYLHSYKRLSCIQLIRTQRVGPWLLGMLQVPGHTGTQQIHGLHAELAPGNPHTCLRSWFTPLCTDFPYGHTFF